MKRLVLAAVVLSMLAVPTMQVQAAPLNTPNASHSGLVQVGWKKNDRHVVKRKRVVVRKPVVVRKKVVVRKSHWRHGQKYHGWRQHRPIRDHYRYGLRRPGRGQEWVRVGNDYLLVGIASGIIGAMIAAQ